MASKLVWKSCEIYSKIYQSLWDAPMLYNPITHKTIFLRNPRQYRVWTYLIYMTAISFYSFLACGIICLWINEKPIPNSVLIPSCFGSGVCFLVLLGPIFANRCQTACYVLNQGSVLEENFTKEQEKPKRQRHYFGTALVIIVTVSGVIPVFYCLTESLTSYFIVNAFMFKSKFSLVPLSILLFRKIVLFIMVFEFCRLVFGILVSLILFIKVGHLMVCEYSKLGKRAILKCNLSDFQQYFNCYVALMIFVNVAEVTLATLIAISMTGGMFGVVCCNYVTIKMQTTIPKPYYFFFPIISIVILSMISASLPQAVKVHDDSHSNVEYCMQQ